MSVSSESHPHHTLVVGIDGSPSSQAALAWARAHQTQLGQVVPVAAFTVGPFADGFGTLAGSDPHGAPYRTEALDRMCGVIRTVDPSLARSARITMGLAGPVLIRESLDANLLVLGSPRHSALANAFLGSTARHCVRHSSIPVALIPDAPHTSDRLDKVVVGVNGSDHARAALRWAIDHVEPGGRVVAVGVASPGPLDHGDNDRAEALLSDSLAKWVNDETELGPLWLAKAATIETEVRSGDARHELRSAARDADLLVVGARGNRTISRLLLGSVATSVAHHPSVPTVVVPGPSGP